MSLFFFSLPLIFLSSSYSIFLCFMCFTSFYYFFHSCFFFYSCYTQHCVVYSSTLFPHFYTSSTLLPKPFYPSSFVSFLLLYHGFYILHTLILVHIPAYYSLHSSFCLFLFHLLHSITLQVYVKLSLHISSY